MPDTNGQRAAPQLLFDDGSRAIQEEYKKSIDPLAAARDTSIPVRTYYEIDRLLKELQELRDETLSSEDDAITWRNRIALQFPDELLVDAPDVCWEFEQSLPDSLVFVLGDTTYQSCCPDVVAAKHLDADCIIHYGHACLSYSTLPVLYSFGKQLISTGKMLQALKTYQQNCGMSLTPNVLLLFEVKYAHAVQEIAHALETVFESVSFGKVPSSHLNGRHADSHIKSACKVETQTTGATCACSSTEERRVQETVTPLERYAETSSQQVLTLGGLEIPPVTDWSSMTLLFVGQDEASRPFQNIMLRFLSDAGNAPAAYWTWNPKTETLSTEISPHLSRVLSRRFYLVQKAKLAKVFGILVSNPSDRTTRPVVKHLQTMLQRHGAAQYNFMVGKVNPSKLANFAEVDAYCLVSCPEHSLLENERSDYPTPILTPLEVAMALGGVEWGALPYSLNAVDFLQEVSGITRDVNGGSTDDDGDGDAPYFNPVTGAFESDVALMDDSVDLQALPGKGQLTTYQSAAADFLRQRSYQGLTVDAGETAVQTAIAGQQGIASDYGNR